MKFCMEVTFGGIQLKKNTVSGPIYFPGSDFFDWSLLKIKCICTFTAFAFTPRGVAWFEPTVKSEHNFWCKKGGETLLCHKEG